MAVEQVLNGFLQDTSHAPFLLDSIQGHLGGRRAAQNGLRSFEGPHNEI